MSMASHPLYKTWHSMITRCHNSNHPSFKNYGKKGIVVCDKWRYNFYKFVEDVGSKPSKNHDIDRIDNNGNYTPENCVWLPKGQQSKNRNFVDMSKARN